MSFHFTHIVGLLAGFFFLMNESAGAVEKKELMVPKVHTSSVLSACDVPALLDSCKVPFHNVDIVNWEKYAYRPEVSFRMAHTGSAILLNYRVNEKSVRAVTLKDNGDVYTDSCVEFFVSPDSDSLYYNFECNCVGTLLIESGTYGGVRTKADAATLAAVKRWSSLGRIPFSERMGPCRWELVLIIPVEAFTQHSLNSLDGLRMKGNFYKCGDKTITPHFLSWSPIDLPHPAFHCPQFFGTLLFAD